MNKQTKRWRALTAAVCIGLGVMTGMVGTQPTANAEHYGVVMDMRLTQVIPFRIQNFTPYQMEYVGNKSNTEDIFLSSGVPQYIAPVSEKGNNAMIYALYLTPKGNNVWHPSYRIRAKGGNYVNLDFQTDVTPERMTNVSMDALPFIISSIKCVAALGGQIAAPENIGGYLEFVESLMEAQKANNSITITDYVDVAGKGYVYGTSTNNTSDLIRKNDGTVVQVGDGSSGEQFVIETVAVRRPAKLMWEGYSSMTVLKKSTAGSDGTDAHRGTITMGGKQYAAINIYTHESYMTMVSIAVAKDLWSAYGFTNTGDKMALADDLQTDTASFGGIDESQANVASFGDTNWNGIEPPQEIDSFAVNMTADMAADNGLNEECKKLTKMLAEPIVCWKDSKGKHAWFSDKMVSLKSGERIDVYEALYWAQKKKSGFSMGEENPLKPGKLRQAMTGAMEGFDLGKLESSDQISDQELKGKLLTALKRLGIQPNMPNGAAEPDAFAGGFDAGF